MNERRIKRLEAQIRARAAEILQREIADPRCGLVTITRVKLDRELELCRVYWSVLGDEKDRKLNEEMLEHATPYVRRGVAKVLHTRTAPRVQFEFDESIAGAIRVQSILEQLRDERVAREGEGAESPETESPGAESPEAETQDAEPRRADDAPQG